LPGESADGSGAQARGNKQKQSQRQKPWGIRKKNLAKLGSYMEDDFVTVRASTINANQQFW
jgi:hypothetical protein